MNIKSIWEDSVFSKFLGTTLSFAVGVLAVALVSLLFTSYNIKNVTIYGCGFIVVLILVLFILKNKEKKKNPEIIVLEPADHSSQGPQFTMYGTFKQMPNVDRTYIIVYNSITNRFWPKGKLAPNIVTKEWSAIVGIGGGIGEERIIYVCHVGNNALRQIRNEAIKQNGIPATKAFIDDLTAYAAINITKNA